MTKIFLFILGILFSVVGLIYIISYLNLLSLGYNFLEYGKFICSKIECLVGIVGIIIIFFTIITMKGDKKWTTFMT